MNPPDMTLVVEIQRHARYHLPRPVENIGCADGYGFARSNRPSRRAVERARPTGKNADRDAGSVSQLECPSPARALEGEIGLSLGRVGVSTRHDRRKRLTITSVLEPAARHLSRCVENVSLWRRDMEGLHQRILLDAACTQQTGQCYRKGRAQSNLHLGNILNID